MDNKKINFIHEPKNQKFQKTENETRIENKKRK